HERAGDAIDAAEAARVFYLVDDKLRVIEAGADHYAVLEVERRATPEAIKKSYRDLAKVFHPDRYAQLANIDSDIKRRLSAVFDAVTKAYTILSNARERTAYVA